MGFLQTNCYVVSSETKKDAIIIDPGFTEASEELEITGYIKCEELMLKYILNTHGHPDHTCANGIIKNLFKIPILVHEADAFLFGQRGKQVSLSMGFEAFSPEPDRFLYDGEIVSLTDFSLRVLHTPGHSPGSICFVGEEELFTGDTLFEGSIGRTDFPSSSEADMEKSLKKLAGLDGAFRVFPGHGFDTTMEKEKRTNPFLRFSQVRECP